MWFYSGHANIYVSKREARSERITGFGCDTGFGARDVDLLFALPEPACASLNQPPSPLCPQLPSATADFSPFWGISFMGLGQIWGKKELFNSTWRSECLGDVVIVENYGNLSSGGHLQNLFSALHAVLGLWSLLWAAATQTMVCIQQVAPQISCGYPQQICI